MTAEEAARLPRERAAFEERRERRDAAATAAAAQEVRSARAVALSEPLTAPTTDAAVMHA